MRGAGGNVQHRRDPLAKLRLPYLSWLIDLDLGGTVGAKRLEPIRRRLSLGSARGPTRSLGCAVPAVAAFCLNGCLSCEGLLFSLHPYQSRWRGNW
ncbi:Hypothetical protein NTJ_00116 [Nesidiocoris tenuis]|uniref:Uncharacterized protein n=1 Tax=Nesidiocoris tenuis TaxID=355587 RepID=A0ABN7A5A7_9HEMI|nr:Hypothetical protein NTJ_00116 [Nesidiocoris tenuis]